MKRHIPLLVGVLQIGGYEAGLELGGVFGIVYASREHLRQVSSESAQAVREVGVEALVQEHQVDQAVVQNEGFLRSDQLQEERTNILALVLIALVRGGLKLRSLHLPIWLHLPTGSLQYSHYAPLALSPHLLLK